MFSVHEDPFFFFLIKLLFERICDSGFKLKNKNLSIPLQPAAKHS